MAEIVRLDILIYAHDGRGLGHASRSIGVGLALRRLFPHLKILFVSGCRQTSELIGAGPLDWLKLPSYETEVVDGKSKGIAGKSMFSDAELGALRARELEALVTLYNPRLVLVDHTPQGKHRELLPALSATYNKDTLWVLGVRGVVGAVAQAQSESAGKLFRLYYHSLLWYGDSDVLGKSHLELLREQYDTEAIECGYVLRLSEFTVWNDQSVNSAEKLAGTISIPWLGENTAPFLLQLANTLTKVPRSLGFWHLFIDSGSSPESQKYVRNLFADLDNCRVEPPSANYVQSLLRSKTALVYGGYNSVMDILYTGIPALVVLREMRDDEQRIHLARIIEATGGHISTVTESSVTSTELEKHLLGNLQKTENFDARIQMDGASRAARYLGNLLS